MKKLLSIIGITAVASAAIIPLTTTNTTNTNQNTNQNLRNLKPVEGNFKINVNVPPIDATVTGRDEQRSMSLSTYKIPYTGIKDKLIHINNISDWGSIKVNIPGFDDFEKIKEFRDFFPVYDDLNPNSEYFFHEKMRKSSNWVNKIIENAAVSEVVNDNEYYGQEYFNWIVYRMFSIYEQDGATYLQFAFVNRIYGGWITNNKTATILSTPSKAELSISI